MPGHSGNKGWIDLQHFPPHAAPGLRHLAAMLARDPAHRGRFLRFPAALLRQAGLQISPQVERNLQRLALDTARMNAETVRISVRRDHASGQATGKRQHTPVAISKSLDAASPGLFPGLFPREIRFDFSAAEAGGEVNDQVLVTFEHGDVP